MGMPDLFFYRNLEEIKKQEEEERKATPSSGAVTMPVPLPHQWSRTGPPNRLQPPRTGPQRPPDSKTGLKPQRPLPAGKHQALLLSTFKQQLVSAVIVGQGSSMDFGSRGLYWI